MHHKFIRRHACDQAPDLPEGRRNPPEETDLISPATASLLYGISPYRLRSLTTGPDAPARPVFIAGRRRLRLRDVEGLARHLRDAASGKEDAPW
jgi:hypothetical protein